MVKFDIVQDHNIPFEQRWNQKMFDVQIKDLSIVNQIKRG
jgi:hypothetical protein